MFLIVQQIDNNLVTPILVGESVGIHPLVVMIALLIGGTLIGPLGMLLAVPATGIDRKSTRLNHKPISYAVFCLKKKKITQLSSTH